MDSYLMNLREWRKSKELSQEALGRKLGFGDQWKTYQSYESGRTVPPQSIKDKLKKFGYAWPSEEAKSNQDAATLTREEFAEWRGYWKAGTEKLLSDLVDQSRRIAELEKQVSDLQQRVSR
jgi:transcriptional regulator with XRE-family HTH domain